MDKDTKDYMEFDKYITDYPVWDKKDPRVIWGVLDRRAILVGKKIGASKGQYKKISADHIDKIWDEK
jgi:hypothetical protein